MSTHTDTDPTPAHGTPRPLNPRPRIWHVSVTHNRPHADAVTFRQGPVVILAPTLDDAVREAETRLPTPPTFTRSHFTVTGSYYEIDRSPAVLDSEHAAVIESWAVSA